MSVPLLSIEALTVGFTQYDGRGRQHLVPTIRDLAVSVDAGEVVAIIGASGSGKSLLAHSICGLFAPNATVTGQIRFCGELLDAAGLERLRGSGIALVPQSVTSLDPLMTIGRQVLAGRPTVQRRQRMAELFARYGLAPDVADLYPFELSGGMARRTILVAALIDDPKVIVADEPTPGMHAELARLAMADFRDYSDAGHGVLLITHDVELAIEVADRIAVFHDGTTIEQAPASHFAEPERLTHPFSRALVRALPSRDFDPEWEPS